MAEKVTNGTCEAWSSATDLDNWTESLTGGSTINRESAEQYDGTYCLRFNIDASNNPVSETQAITLVAGNSYLLSFWYKSDESSGVALQIGLVDSADNVWLQSDGTWEDYGSYDGGFTNNPTTTYTHVKVPFTAHASYTAYNLSIKCGSLGV